jgi:hypothetical protein
MFPHPHRCLRDFAGSIQFLAEEEEALRNMSIKKNFGRHGPSGTHNWNNVGGIVPGQIEYNSVRGSQSWNCA